MKKRYVKIPPPGTRKPGTDWYIIAWLVVIWLMGIVVGYTVRDCIAKAELKPVTQTERIELRQIVSEAVWVEPMLMTAPERVSLGKFTITAYCPCEICCGEWSNPDNPLTASGAPAVEGVTVASDWQTLPKGTEIHIDGIGSRTVQDKPAKWIVDKYDGKIIDLYFSSHKDAWNFGKQELEVWTYDPPLCSMP